MKFMFQKTTRKIYHNFALFSTMALISNKFNSFIKSMMLDNSHANYTKYGNFNISYV
jgi:hypothetical protein